MISLEQIRSLSPDPGTFERSRKLLSARHWRELGGTSQMVWGSCRSSGTRRHQLVVELGSEPAFQCTCPAAKKPCKHVLALLQLLHTHSDAFRVGGDPPDWVGELRSRLRQPADPEATAAAHQRRAAQRTRQRDQRLERMKEGCRDLERWLLDLIRQGLAQTQVQPDQFWEEMATRLVDAKLGGLARRVRKLPQLSGKEDWPEQMLGELSELYLLTRSFERIDELSPTLRREMLNVAGLNVRKEELEKIKGITDKWVVVGNHQGVEEQLRFQRTYLLGSDSGRTALILEFAWGDQTFNTSWPVGAAYQAELAFFPSSYPLRAQVRRYQPHQGALPLPAGFSGLKSFARAYAQALAANPWLPAFPAAIDNLLPVVNETQLSLIDRHRHQLRAGTLNPQSWKLVAVSSGYPLWVFGEWDGQQFIPLSTVQKDQIISLES